MVKCPNCGHINDADAKFCENCGANLRVSGGMPTSTKVLMVVVIVLVLGLGLVSGMLLVNNQAKPITNTSADNATANVSQSPTQTAQSSSQFKSYSNGVISFQYPSSWDVLPNIPNTMVIVGLSNYPSFSVYNESKYGHTSLSDYVSHSKTQMISNGYIVKSEQSRTVNGLPAYEIVYQGKTISQEMVLVEKSPGSQYFALVGVDNVDHFDQVKSTFNQIVNSFKFL